MITVFCPMTYISDHTQKGYGKNTIPNYVCDFSKTVQYLNLMHSPFLYNAGHLSYEREQKIKIYWVPYIKCHVLGQVLGLCYTWPHLTRPGGDAVTISSLHSTLPEVAYLGLLSGCGSMLGPWEQDGPRSYCCRSNSWLIADGNLGNKYSSLLTMCLG